MILSDLQAFVPSLKLLWREYDETPIDGLGALNPGMGQLLPRRLYFVGSERYRQIFQDKLTSTSADDIGCVVPKGATGWESLRGKVAYVAQVDNIPLAMGLLSRPFYDRVMEQVNDLVDGRQMGSAEIHPTAHIAQNVFLGAKVVVQAGVRLHPGAVLLSGVVVGRDSVIYPNVTVYHNVQIGQRVRIHSGAVIGCDGLGFNFDQGVQHKVWHMGSAVIEDDVEIGVSSCVDQGTFGPTVIGVGSKLDGQVRVSHNCQVGRGVIMCGQAAVGGSSVVGDFCVFGGRAAIGDNVVLGDHCQLAAGAIVTTDWPAGSVLGGHPARPLKEWLKGVAKLRSLSLKRS